MLVENNFEENGNVQIIWLDYDKEYCKALIEEATIFLKKFNFEHVLCLKYKKYKKSFNKCSYIAVFHLNA
jgi:hypothetical protein